MITAGRAFAFNLLSKEWKTFAESVKVNFLLFSMNVNLPKPSESLAIDLATQYLRDLFWLQIYMILFWKKKSQHIAKELDFSDNDVTLVSITTRPWKEKWTSSTSTFTFMGYCLE